MSKVEELRKKYSILHAATFAKFVVADTTPTKKYLEYMVNLWITKNQRNGPNTIAKLIEEVKKFDSLLPYIQNKDIYSKEYIDFQNLQNVLWKAEEVRDEKTFVMSDHCEIIEETEDYLLLRPLTMRGSLKYGANTKWCTASRKYGYQFENYIKRGLLLYLISKKKDRGEDVMKVAFFTDYGTSPFAGGISIFDAKDRSIADIVLIEKGWAVSDVFKIVSTYRARFAELSLTKKSRDFVDNFTTLLQNLNLTDLQKHVKLLEDTQNNSYISTLKGTIEEFTKNLNKIQNGFTNTTN